MGPISGPCGQYMDLFLRKISSKLNQYLCSDLVRDKINKPVYFAYSRISKKLPERYLGSKKDPSGTQDAIPNTKNCYL